MELKPLMQSWFRQKIQASNCTNMELKLNNRHFMRQIRQTSNCTNMELKQNKMLRKLGTTQLLIAPIWN